MKQVEGKARRTAKYHPLFFVVIAGWSVAWFAICMTAYGWNWTMGLGFAMSGFFLGMIVGIIFRDAR